MAWTAGQAGEYEETMRWVEQWINDPWNFASLKMDPIFYPLRSDPRFQALMKIAGMDK